MNCLEAQSKIMAFIDNKLPDDELKEFIKHVKTCENCAEELEIYYTLVVGMKQLDSQVNPSMNFKQELNKKLDAEMNRMTAVKRIATSTMMLGLIAVILGLVWFYNGVLDKVYRYEQNAKLQAQSKFFFFDTFYNDMFKVNEYSISNLEQYLYQDTNIEIAPENLTFMQKIKDYNRTHMNYSNILIEYEAEVENEEDIDY